MLEYIDRRGTDCFKWDAQTASFGEEGLLALWVADMDFKVDSHITDALRKYVDLGVPAYYAVPDSYYDAFINWEKNEHGFSVEREWIRFTPGVVTGFHMALQALTQPGDAVLICTPVYYPFMNAIKNGGRRMVTSELIRNDVSENGGSCADKTDYAGAGKAGGACENSRPGNGCEKGDRAAVDSSVVRYTMDFDDFEKKIIEEDVRAFILCSPHNPVSRVWTVAELADMLRICREHGVIVISDEIHHDLVFGSNRHIPTLSLAKTGENGGCSDRIVMLTAASKTFNIAGLQNSFVVIPDPDLREAWDKFADAVRISGGNAMGYVAAEAAYTYGKEWLAEVKDVIYGNYIYIKDALLKAMPDLTIADLEGTYLAWIDFGAYLKADEIKPFIQGKCGLAVDYGSWFGGGQSDCCIRVNLATSRANIEEMVRRISNA